MSAARKTLTKRLSALGPLRDAHVQLIDLDARLADFPEMTPLHRLLRRRANRLEESAVAMLRKTGTTKLSHRMKTIRRDLGAALQRSTAIEVLRNSYQRTLRDGLAALAAVRADRFRNEEKVHDVRIALKHLRYGAETLPASVRALAPAQLKRLKAIVAALGRIHDIDVHLDATREAGEAGPAGIGCERGLSRGAGPLPPAPGVGTGAAGAGRPARECRAGVNRAWTNPPRTFEIGGVKIRLLASIALLLLCCRAGRAGAGAGADWPLTRVQERFEFELRDLKVAHQGGNTLTLKLRYDYRPGLKPAEYPDFRKLAQSCEEFFKGYPNDTDFWEILNLKLTARLLREFPALAAITVEIQVAPTERIPFPRSSTVTRSR